MLKPKRKNGPFGAGRGQRFKGAPGAPRAAGAAPPEGALAERTRDREEKARVAEQEEGYEKVISVNRCSKVVKGGKRFSFAALVVVGNGRGEAGYAIGKAHEVADAIRKATAKAKKNVFKVPMKGNTIPHEIFGRFGAGKVMLKPASPGTGIIAGGPVRALCQAVGIKDILTKCLGTNNAINVIKAVESGFRHLITAEMVSRRTVDVETPLKESLPSRGEGVLP